MMYSSVPPPSSESPPNQSNNGDDQRAQESDHPLPRRANILQDQWEKFQKLKSRRIEVCGKGETQRVNLLRAKTLRTVSKELSDTDKAILEGNGVTLPLVKMSRKRKHHSLAEKYSTFGTSEPGLKSTSLSSAQPSTSSQLEVKWNELRQHFDPNPQLKGWDKGSLREKSGLEKALDTAVERGMLEEASTISDELANREFATKIATAFDCVDYIKKKKIEEERKRSRKPAKLKWSFEQKKRWETKGNM